MRQLVAALACERRPARAPSWSAGLPPPGPSGDGRVRGPRSADCRIASIGTPASAAGTSPNSDSAE